MIERIKEKVKEILYNDKSGHGMDHIYRVLNLSLKFAEKEDADKNLTALIALLHDVDDYKLFGKENAKNLTNAKKIMNYCDINTEVQDKVCAAISKIGYNKRLSGDKPESLECKIVSDADMCDALGANGLIRAHKYSIKHGASFFDKNIFPVENITAENYTKQPASTSVCHVFEKLLKLKNLMLTESGKSEAQSRYDIIVEFLRHLFDEENASEWKIYMDNYLKMNG